MTRVTSSCATAFAPLGQGHVRQVDGAADIELGDRDLDRSPEWRRPAPELDGVLDDLQGAAPLQARRGVLSDDVDRDRQP